MITISAQAAIGKGPTWQEDYDMKKYVCTVCGYIYDPEAGDPDAGVAPNAVRGTLMIGSALYAV